MTNDAHQEVPELTEVNPYVFLNAEEATSNKLAALLYAAEGIGVIPVEMRPERAKDKVGKKPAIYEWQRNFTVSPDQICEWWDDEPGHGVGIIPGTANLAVVDIDGPEGMEDWRGFGYDLDGITPTIQTPGRGNAGYHLYFSVTDEQLSRIPHTVKLGERQKIDLITVRRFVAVPPTVRPSNDNKPYKVVYLPDEFSPLPEPIFNASLGNQIVHENFGVSASNPDCVRCPAAVAGKIEDIRVAAHGKGNDTFFRKINEILELPCLSDLQRKEAVQGALGVVTGTDPQGWRSPISKRYAVQQIKSAISKQRQKGGYGTGPCQHALRHSRVSILGKSVEQEEDQEGFAIYSDADRETIPTTKWLWKPYIPAGTVSTLLGREGRGKSMFLRWVAARLSNGELPGNSEQGTTLWLTAEEDPDRRVIPAMRLSGIRPGCSFYQDLLNPKTRSFAANDGGVHFAELAKRIPKDRPPLRLVVLDSLEYFFKGSDMNQSGDVKEGFQGLLEQAMRFNCAVVIVQHLNKNSERKGMARGAGSLSIPASVRSGLGFGYHPTQRGKFVLAIEKASYADVTSRPAEIFDLQVGEHPTYDEDLKQEIMNDFGYLTHNQSILGISVDDLFVDQTKWMEEDNVVAH